MNDDEMDPIDGESGSGGLNEETIDDFLEDEGTDTPEGLGEEE